MSTWEDRMAGRARVRREAAEAEQRRTDEENDPHKGHHVHLDGTLVVCSCGEDFGVTCVALPSELDDLEPDEAYEAYRRWRENMRCPVCGKQGVWSSGSPDGYTEIASEGGVHWYARDDGHRA